MVEKEKELVFSQTVKAGKRIYYFDVKQSRNGDRYLSITESKKIVEGTAENPRFSFEKHKIFLYKEDYDKFLNAMLTSLEVAKGGTVPEVMPLEAPATFAAAPVAEIKVEKPAEPVAPAVPSKPEAPAEPAPVATEEPAFASVAAEETFKIDLDF